MDAVYCIEFSREDPMFVLIIGDLGVSFSPVPDLRPANRNRTREEQEYYRRLELQGYLDADEEPPRFCEESEH